MSNADLLLFFGRLVSLWAIGFTGGYLFTRFREAMNQIG